MKKFYCCDYCDELFETEAECKAHEATCTEKKDYDESRKMDKDSLILHLRELIEEIEIFNEAYGADIMDELIDDFRDGKLSFDGCDCEHKCDDTCDCDCEDKEYTFYLNGKQVSKEDLKKELAKIFSTKVVPAAKDATKTAVKKTDDFLTTILEKLDK